MEKLTWVPSSYTGPPKTNKSPTEMPEPDGYWRDNGNRKERRTKVALERRSKFYKSKGNRSKK